MPEGDDRTDYEKVRRMTDHDIDYSDIPPLTSAVWSGEVHHSKDRKRHVHVVRDNGSWAIKLHAPERNCSMHATQAEAIHEARALARQACLELYVHARDGRIRMKRDYRGRGQKTN